MEAGALPALRAVADFPDPELLRFWRAAKKELSAAKAALRATVAWRKDRAAELQGADAQLVSSWLSVIGEDAHGWPVYCIAPSAIAVDDVGRVSDERVVAIVINAFETLRSEVRRLGADGESGGLERAVGAARERQGDQLWTAARVADRHLAAGPVSAASGCNEDAQSARKATSA